MSHLQRIVCQVTLGAAESTVVIDNVAYSPDMVRDAVNRCKEALGEAVRLSVEVGLPEFPVMYGEGDDDMDDFEALMMEGDADGDE